MTEPAYDILLIGGGIASASAAAELRERGFEGSILLATRELDPPYHRPPITKGYLQGREDRESTLIHPEAWYAEHDVEVRTRAGVMDIDLEARTAKIGRELVGFGQALVATGAGVRRLQAEGGQRDGIHYLRALPQRRQAARRRSTAPSGSSIVGGSYIATEVAASLTRARQARARSSCRRSCRSSAASGPSPAQFVHDLLTSHGIEIVAGADVSALRRRGRGRAGRAPSSARTAAASRPTSSSSASARRRTSCSRARRASSSARAAASPATSGCGRRPRGSGPPATCASSTASATAAGCGSSTRRSPPRRVATSARAMLGSDEPYADVPYFWSDLADWATLEYVGNASTGWDEEIVHGDPGGGRLQRLVPARTTSSSPRSPSAARTTSSSAARSSSRARAPSACAARSQAR